MPKKCVPVALEVDPSIWFVPGPIIASMMSFPSVQQIPIPPTTNKYTFAYASGNNIEVDCSSSGSMFVLYLEMACCNKWIRIACTTRIVPPTIAYSKAGFQREILVGAPVLAVLVVRMMKHVSTMSVKDPMLPMTILSFRQANACMGCYCS